MVVVVLNYSKPAACTDTYAWRSSIIAAFSAAEAWAFRYLAFLSFFLFWKRQED